MRLSIRAVALAVLTSLATAHMAAATTLAYRIGIDREAGRIRVTFDLDEYLYETCTIPLGSPAAPAEDYFAYFDAVTFEDADGRPLEVRRSGPGVVEVSGIHGSVRGSYDVLVSELNEVLGTGPRMPVLTDDYTVLPLESLLGLPAEVEEKGLVFAPFSIAFDAPEGWPLYAPWHTYGGRTEMYEGYEDEIRSAIVCMGEFDVRDETEAPIPGLFILRGGDAATRAAFQEKCLALVRFFGSVLGTPGKPVVFVGQLSEESEPATRGYGRFVRTSFPGWLALTSAAEVSVGTNAYDFYLRFAHELFHHWLGVRGQLRPLNAESYWATEGMADYFAAMALDRTGIAAEDSFLDHLAHAAESLRALPDRERPIDETAETYESDPEYRRRLLIKSPLVCFLLETHLVTARKEGHSLASVLRGVFFSAFVKGQAGAGTNFGSADVATQLNKVLGLRGQILLGNYIRGDCYPLLEERAVDVGLSWKESGDGTVHVGWARPAEETAFWRAFPGTRS